MRDLPFAERMDVLWRALDEYELEEVVSAARVLHGELAAEAVPDGKQLGWAFYALFKALHGLHRHDEAAALLASDEDGHTHLIAPVNRAWMYAAGAECAVVRGDATGLLRLGEKCLALYMRLDDLDAALRTASSLCTALMSRELFRHNGLFARFLVEHAATAGRWQLVGLGITQLHWHGKQTGDPQVRAEAAAALQKLAATRVADAEEQAAIDAVVDDQRRILGLTAADNDDETTTVEMPLWDAASAGDEHRVAVLLAAGADIDAVHPGAAGVPTALIVAAYCGHTGVVRLLLTAGADVHATNSQGRSALFQAADQGHAQIVVLLARAGAAVDTAALFGQTALHIAAWQGHHAVVLALLASGARLDLRDDAGMTPLALACTEDVPEVIEALLDAGALLDERSGATEATPLILAAIDGQARVAAALLARGARRDVRDRNGRTAAEWARAEHHAALADSLEV